MYNFNLAPPQRHVTTPIRELKGVRVEPTNPNVAVSVSLDIPSDGTPVLPTLPAVRFLTAGLSVPEREICRGEQIYRAVVDDRYENLCFPLS